MILLGMLWLDLCRVVSMIILLAAVFIRQAALRLWDLAHGNLGRTCLIQVGYSCQTTFVKQHIRCIALHFRDSCSWLTWTFTFAIHLFYCAKIGGSFTHAIIMKTYEKDWKSPRFITHMRFTSRTYTDTKWVSPSFRHKMRSGLDFAAIGCDQTDRFGQGWNSLLTYSVARSSFWLREASNFEPGAGTVTCIFSGQKRPERGWRKLV